MHEHVLALVQELLRIGRSVYVENRYLGMPWCGHLRLVGECSVCVCMHLDVGMCGWWRGVWCAHIKCTFIYMYRCRW